MMGRFAATHNTAIVLVGHMNKNESSKDIYRGFGSADIGATVRSLLKVDIDKDDKSIRTIRAIKSNFDDSCFDPIGIEMDEEKRIKLYDMSPEVPDRKLAQAVAFFQAYLKDGMKPFSEVMAAQTDAGIKERTGRRARHIAKVKKVSRNGVDYLMLSNRR